MTEIEPGLDLHEWETRWAQLEEQLADDPRGGLVEACDLIEETLGPEPADDELYRAYRAARDIADRVERNEEVDAGDIGAAVENLRLVRAAIGPGATGDSF